MLSNSLSNLLCKWEMFIPKLWWRLNLCFKEQNLPNDFFFYLFLTDLAWIYIHQNEIKATLTNSWLFQKKNQAYFWLWCCRHKVFFQQTTGTPPIQFKWHIHAKQKRIHVNIRVLTVIWDILAKPCIGLMHRKLFAKIYWCQYKKFKQ